MGNIGLEPEITREYLADEYRKACATINELRERAEKAIIRAETAEAARDAAIKEMASEASKRGYVEAENDALRYAMREAVGDLECADSQSIASDDQIIMEHVRLASKTLRIAMAKKGQPR